MEVQRLAPSAMRGRVANGLGRTPLCRHRLSEQTAASRRHQSSTARTKRALTIAPHKSFLNPAATGDHIIFNPPSSQASVYHTPFKFLPKNDPRRRANLTQLFESSTTIRYNPSSPQSRTASSTLPSPTVTSSSSTAAAAAAGSAAATLPPLAHPTAARVGPNPDRHLSPADVAEIRRLRAEDPARWSVLSLARRFGCSQLFVLICCQAPAEHRQAERERVERLRARWGPIRTRAREDRARRTELLLRGEI